MSESAYLDVAQLEAGLPSIRQSPVDHGVLEMIVRRPQIGEREVLHDASVAQSSTPPSVRPLLADPPSSTRPSLWLLPSRF